MIHFKEQEKFVKIPSLREFQPSKLFVELVNFNKFCCTCDNTSNFKLEFSPFHYTVVVYRCPIGHQHILIMNECRQSI